MKLASKVARKVASKVAGKLTGSVDADAQAFLAATEITDATITTAINDLVVAWKASGQWDRTLAIYPFVGGSASSHKWNLKDPRDEDDAFRLTFGGTVAHDANEATPNGSTGYANTHIDPNAHLPPYSASFGYYSRSTTAPGASDYFLCGARLRLRLDTYNTSSVNLNNAFVTIGGSSTSLTGTGVVAWSGLLGFSMYGNNQTIYRNQSVLASSTDEVYNYWGNTESVANRKWWLFANNFNAAVSLPTDRPTSGVFIGYGMTSEQWGLLADAMANFQTALGRAA